MSLTVAHRLTHPALLALRQSARDERRRLCRALAIEADWRFHDGPEWAAQYWSAFGDLRRDAERAPDMRVAAAAAERGQWPALAPVAAEQSRAIFRALLATLHPDVAPAAARADVGGIWARAMRAYRHGDASALRALLAEARPLGAAARLPEEVVALRRERDRLRHKREAVDRRLAELSQQFPFCLRDRLSDAGWIRRQRLALRQAIALSAAPLARPAPADRKRVS